MASRAQGEVPTGMQRICRRFERWRSSHRGRLPIPEGLWASAAAVAREHGVFQTAKVLRLEYGKLKRMVEAAPRRPTGRGAPSGPGHIFGTGAIAGGARWARSIRVPD